jgi:adenine-specific DNA methylase
MARNKNSKHNHCGFDDETTPIVNPVDLFRKSQDRLYKLDNPYVGSKRGILPDIADSFNRHGVKFDTMLDLFSGSGVVSIFFKMLGKRVISNDLLTASYYNALAFVENENVVLTAEQIDFLCKNPNPNKGTYVATNFDRFTPEESAFLDNYRANIDTLTNKAHNALLQQSPHLAKVMTGTAHSDWIMKETRQVEIVEALATVLIEHYVMSRCFIGGRLNHGQILAELEHRINHDRNGGRAMRFTLDPLPSFIDGARGCLAYNGDAIETAKKVRVDVPDVQLAYLDPPYGQAQSDYANMYQFCEEYIHRAPLDGLPHISAASAKFAKAKHYKDHFREVLREVEWIPTWAVSFNASSFEDSKGIESILKEFKKDVTVVNIDHEYRYRKSRSKAVEYLFIAR